MAEFKILFERYGADYDVTIKRFMGNEELYLKFLCKLFQDPNLGMYQAIQREYSRVENLWESMKRGEQK